MEIAAKQKIRISLGDWHWKFAWFPTRTSPTRVVWLGWFQRKLEMTAEGGWAGGDRYRWHFANPGGKWVGPEFE